MKLRSYTCLPRARSIVRIMVTGGLLALAPAIMPGSTITSFGPTTPLGCSTLPGSATTGSPNLFNVNLTLPSCAISYTAVGGPATSYPFTFSITNNTGQIMTDLHFQLFSSLPNLPGIGTLFSGATVNSGPLPLTSATTTTLDFVGPPNLGIGATEVISVFLNLAALPAAISYSDTIVITPTFNGPGGGPDSPEPASLALSLSGVLLVGFGVWRRKAVRGLTA